MLLMLVVSSSSGKDKPQSGWCCSRSSRRARIRGRCVKTPTRRNGTALTCNAVAAPVGTAISTRGQMIVTPAGQVKCFITRPGSGSENAPGRRPPTRANDRRPNTLGAVSRRRLAGSRRRTMPQNMAEGVRIAVGSQPLGRLFSACCRKSGSHPPAGRPSRSTQESVDEGCSARSTVALLCKRRTL